MQLARIGDYSFRYRGLLLPVAILILLIPSPRIAADPAAIGIAGLVIALFGQGIRAGTIGLAYIIRGGKDHRVYAEELVTSGIYAHVRNPMYLGNAFLLAGLATASNSWLFVLVGVPIALAVHATIIAAEENFLRKRFGAQYEAYCARVPRLLPKLPGLPATFGQMRFDWRKVVRQEYAKPFDWIVAIAVVIVFNLWRADLIDEHRALVVVLLLIIAARLAVWTIALRLKPGGGSKHSADTAP
jgi:protein-S-isoprenylcysteine O-methyltransferase Ste14